MCGRKRRNTGSTARISAFDAYRAFFATVFGKMEMAEARLPHNCRERRLPFLLCRHRRKDAEARAGDDVLVKLAIDAPLDLVRKVLKYV